MAKKVTLGGGLEFKTRKAAFDFFKEILWSYDEGEAVTDRVHASALTRLIENHPERKVKVGEGIQYFYVDRGGEHPTRCFHIRRVDESTTDFSYPTAVKGEHAPLLTQFKGACRKAVSKDIALAKEQFFDKNADEEGRVQCEVTRAMITSQECHVDHKIPFNILVEDWIDAKNLEINEEILSEPADMQYSSSFRDQNLEKEFVDYHRRVSNKRGNLRMLAIKPNLKLSASAKIYPSKQPVIIPEE